MAVPHLSPLATALALAGAAAVAVPVVGVARGAWLVHRGADPAVRAEARVRALAGAVPPELTVLSCRATRDDRLRWAFLSAYFLAPALVRTDAEAEPAVAAAGALARGGTIVVDHAPGAPCPPAIDAALEHGAGPPRLVVRLDEGRAP